MLVEINVNDRLWDHIPVTIGSKEPIIVKLFFEKLPKWFCKICRVIAHTKKKCSTTKYPEHPVKDTIMEELEEKEETETFVEEQTHTLSNATYTATTQLMQQQSQRLIIEEGSNSGAQMEVANEVEDKENNK